MSNITESLTDSVALSDSLLSLRGFVLSDGIVISDAERNLLGIGINTKFPVGSTIDGLTLSDSIRVSLFVGSLNLFDSLTLADSLKSFAPYITAVSDSISLSDSVGVGQLVLFDSLNLTDAVAFGPAMSVLDGLGLSDAAGFTLINNFLALTEILGDSLSFFDSTQHSAFPVGEALSDHLTFVDLCQAAFFSNPVPYLRRYLNDVVPN